MKKRLAIIFDLDGTLIDTEIIHAEAETRLLNDLGVKTTPEEISRRYAGIPTEVYIEKIANYSSPLNDLLLKKEEILENIAGEKGIYPISSMPELISYLSSLSVPIFVASSSSLEWIQKCLNVPFQMGFRIHSYGDYFNRDFISNSEVQKSKPAPDIFLEAKNRMQGKYNFLKGDEAEWIVVGDSMADMRGAISANMKALILGKFEDGFTKNTNAMFFPTSEKLATHIKKIIKDVY